jgi:RimJ/RimL family protein N-acetyltransferase
VNAIASTAAVELDAAADWFWRLRHSQGIDAARSAAKMFEQRFPDHRGIAEISRWHEPLWWRSFAFGRIRLVRRGPEHFDFVRSVLNDRYFSYRLKRLPEPVSDDALRDTLARDMASLLPESRNIQWVIFQDALPIGLSMFVNINFMDRTAEQIMGVLPSHDVSFLVGDAYCASLMFAFNCIGLNKVRGLIYASNEEIALQQQRLGFRREGVLRQAVWNAELGRYEDLVQIALLREEFAENFVLQRHIRRQSHDPQLHHVNAFPRDPLLAVRG